MRVKPTGSGREQAKIVLLMDNKKYLKQWQKIKIEYILDIKDKPKTGLVYQNDHSPNLSNLKALIQV